jgi:hypothetical protein
MLPNPGVLIFHFFRVALWGAWKAISPFPTPSKLWNCYKVLSAASWIVIPLMKGEKVFSWFATVLSLAIRGGAKVPRNKESKQISPTTENVS